MPSNRQITVSMNSPISMVSPGPKTCHQAGAAAGRVTCGVGGVTYMRSPYNSNFAAKNTRYTARPGTQGIAAQGVSLIYSPTVARHSAVHLANLDLNLLVVLRELLRERNVTRAAARLGVSQPAASAALARLRRHFGDELLVGSGN